MSLPPYVQLGGEQVFEQPFACENTLFYGMILPADFDAIQKNVCDRMFNEPSGEPGRFKPFGPFVMLAICKLDKLVSETEPYSEWGAFAEQEVAFWVLTIDTKTEQVYFAFPYIWVDNAYALSMGREIYGFPKQLGSFEIPSDVNKAEHFSLSSLVLKRLDPGTMGKVQQVLEVNKISSETTAQVWENAAEAAMQIAKATPGQGGLGADFKLLEHLIGDAIHLTVPFAFLKQIRDVADGSKACYQAVIETDCKMTKWHGGGMLDGAYEVTFDPIGSEKIVTDLGLASARIVPGIAFWCEFDFWIGPGTEIWKA